MSVPGRVSMERVLREAIKTYGEDMQKNIAIEEMAELTKEICKDKRGLSGKLHMAEEIADVEIMIEQLKIMYGLHEHVNDFKKSKVFRLAKRLELEGVIEF